MSAKKINFSTVLAGQKLGVEEVEDGIWLVSFMEYDPGYIDPEQKTLQTIDIPFAPNCHPCLKTLLPKAKGEETS